MSRMTPASNVAAAITAVAKCGISAEHVCRVACRSSTSVLHRRKRVALPVSKATVGRAIRNSQRPIYVRAAYHATIWCALCAGSYGSGWTLLRKSAAMKRAAGRTRSTSALAMVYLLIRILLYIVKHPAGARSFDRIRTGEAYQATYLRHLQHWVATLSYRVAYGRKVHPA